MQGRTSTARRGAPGHSITLGADGPAIELSVNDLTRHTLILGSSGAGKTTRAFNPILSQMLGELDAGAFILAPKAETVAEVAEIARQAGREVLIVEPGSAV